MGGVFFGAAVCAALTLAGCSALDESIKLQQKMDEGLSESLEVQHQMSDLMRKTIGIQEQIMQKMENSIEIQKALNQQMEGSVLLQKSVETQLEESVTLQKDLTKQMQASIKLQSELGSGMKTSIELQKKLGEKLDRSNGMQSDMTKKLEDSNTEVSKTRKATEEMLGKVKEQEQSILISQLGQLASYVRDPNQENLYRIGSAMIVYKILLDHQLGADWYSQFVTANLQKCDKRATDIYGDLCTDTFVKEWTGVRGTPPRRAGAVEKAVKGIQEKVDHWVVTEGRKVADLPGFSWVTKVKPLATNVIWILALNPPTIRKFHEVIVENTSNVQHDEGVEFLELSRKVLLESLDVLSFEAKSGSPLPTHSLSEFSRRAGLIRVILDLPDFDNSKDADRLETYVMRLIEAARVRKTPLSKLDEKILEELGRLST